LFGVISEFRDSDPLEFVFACELFHLLAELVELICGHIVEHFK